MSEEKVDHPKKIGIQRVLIEDLRAEPVPFRYSLPPSIVGRKIENQIRIEWGMPELDEIEDA
jgi:hypothetical protein